MRGLRLACRLAIWGKIGPSTLKCDTIGSHAFRFLSASAGRRKMRLAVRGGQESARVTFGYGLFVHHRINGGWVVFNMRARRTTGIYIYTYNNKYVTKTENNEFVNLPTRTQSNGQQSGCRSVYIFEMDVSEGICHFYAIDFLAMPMPPEFTERNHNNRIARCHINKFRHSCKQSQNKVAYDLLFGDIYIVIEVSEIIFANVYI